MKVAVLGAKWSPCAEPIDQTVVPATGLPSPSVQVKAVPPHSWTSIPRWRLYQACSAGAFLALKKMPPMPVTRFIKPLSVRPQPAERRAGDHGVDDAVERVRHRESRALAPPDPVLPVRNDVAAEGDGTTHAEHFEVRRARSVRAAREVRGEHGDEERIDEPLAEQLPHVDVAARRDR